MKYKVLVYGFEHWVYDERANNPRQAEGEAVSYESELGAKYHKIKTFYKCLDKLPEQEKEQVND